MAESDLKVKIIKVAEGLKLASSFPSLSYSEEFFKYREKIYGLSGGFLAVRRKDELLMLLPANYSREAFYSVYKDYTEPLIIKDELPETAPCLIIEKLKKEYGFKKLEFNFGFIKNDCPFILADSGLSTFVLRLSAAESGESLFGRFAKKTRNEIRKAQKRGFDLNIGPLSEIGPIYELYLANMKRHGTPAKSRDYFENLATAYGEKCMVAAAYRDQILAGVNIFLIKGDYLRLQHNYSELDFWPDCVNNLLYYKMIDWGRERGMVFFDFGPSSNSDRSNIHFKLGYGARQISLQKMVDSSAADRLTVWLAGKKHNLKIRLNKIFK